MDKSTYRPDIDGLRAIAVVAVVVNHLNPQLLPGGYLGVDIFFVISGFVITQSLLANKQSRGRAVLAIFYEKRIKRIAPALILNVAVVSLLCYAFQYDPALSIKTGISSLAGFSNLYLITRATDYFAESSYSNFFLHTWSLGVEEQFYLIYPAFFVLSGIGSSTSHKRFAGILLTLSIISFILFVRWWQTDNSIAYFNPISRAWEIFAGCIMFLIASRNNLNLIYRNRLSIIIFIGLLVCLLSYIKSPFQYLIVVISTSVLVLPCRPGLIQQFLSLPLLSKIGKTSYSIYLWHWPAICLLVNFGLEKNNIAIALCISVFSAISLFSYFLVEQPLRKAQWAANTANTIMVGMGATIVALISSFSLHKLDIHKPMFVGKRYAKSNFVSTSLANSDCGLSPNQPYRFPACTVKLDPNKVNNQRLKTKYSQIWILGDSQAAHFAPVASDLAMINNADVNIAAVYGAPFPPVRFIDTKRGAQDSRKRYELQKQNFTSIINNVKLKSAIIIYNSGSYNDSKNTVDLFLDEDWLSASKKSYPFRGRDCSGRTPVLPSS